MHIKDSQRLSYKAITKDDADILFELDQDPAVMRYINGGILTSMETITSKFIPRIESYSNPDKGWGLWRVTLKETNAFIGWVLIRPLHFFTEHPEHDNLEIGWRFMQKAWGKGYATEAARTIKSHITNHSKVEKFTAIAMSDNAASINIMKKLGLKFLSAEKENSATGEINVVYYQS